MNGYQVQPWAKVASNAALGHQQGFESGANLVSNCPSGASLFQTILNRRSTMLWRKMPFPGEKSSSLALSSTVWFLERPILLRDLRLARPWRKRPINNIFDLAPQDHRTATCPTA